MKLISLPKVMEMTQLSKSTVYLLISQGDFPRQMNITKRRVVWLEGDVTSWLKRRLEKNLQKP
ncbi:MAG: helix-turn-helix transcriptional regulator [Methylophilaceae bacterium]